MKPMILSLCAALSLIACVPETAPVSAPAPVAVAAVAPAAAPASGMAGLLNSARAARGLGGLSENARLSAAAQAHAEDMARNGYFSHTGRNGSRFSERARAAGYGCSVAENIASGQQSEAAVMQTWMASEGHRRNILLPQVREFGIGRSGNVWVQMFGTGC